MLTLSETHRKNTQEKNKNERDHIRQVHAERRSRYTKAVEQLANEKAAVRLGGIYTLVGLVDEWLADDSLAEDKQQEEGQVIINNLCSYIRSPFPLAEEIEEYEARKELEKLQKSESEKLSEEESSRLQILLKRFEDSDEYEKPKDITTDYAKFHEEQDVRRTIFSEMSKRSSVIPNKVEGDVTVTPGPWSDFDFDFSRAPVFYPLNRLTIEKGNFSFAKFYSNAVFWSTKFVQTADFRGAKFTKHASFSGTTFTKYVYFLRARFTQNANFSRVRFTQDASFSGAVFTQTANFNGATFKHRADFSRATFTQTADFIWATFKHRADFSRATFTRTADFSRAVFTQTADFSRAAFSTSSPKFVETSEVLGTTFRAQFATLSKNQRAHNFTVAKGSFPIPPGEAEMDGVKYRIPVGTVLFDPSSGKTSEPAKSLDKSNDSKEEKPTE